MSLLRFLSILLIATPVACTVPQPERNGPGKPAAPYDPAETAQAIAAASRRLREHGQAGLSISDVRRTRDWYTPELYELLVRDMSLDVGGGYLNWDPFTGAQDDVGAMSFENVRQAGDTVLVSFSVQGYGGKKDVVTLAMRRVGASWRIANFVYPARSACHRDLAAGMAAYAKKVAEHRADDKGSCTN